MPAFSALARIGSALILDIAIPRDFDPKIGTLDQVWLYNVDDLRAQAERNLRQRRKGIDPALAIIEHETAACFAALRHQRHAGQVLRQISDHADSIRKRELEALYTACPDLTADQRALRSPTPLGGFRTSFSTTPARHSA